MLVQSRSCSNDGLTIACVGKQVEVVDVLVAITHVIMVEGVAAVEEEDSVEEENSAAANEETDAVTSEDAKDAEVICCRGG